MNYGRGFPFPHEDGIVKRRESWTSVTPGKPILQGSDAIPSNMQGNQAGRENWMDLMGMYRNILQEAPDLNVAAQKSNPTGAMAQNEGNQNCKVGLDQNGGLRSSNEGMGQIECIQTYNMGMGQNGGNRNSNVDLGQNGSNRSCYMSVGQDGVIPSYNMGMHQIGGSQNFNMGLVQNGGNCNAVMGQIGGNPNCNMGLGQNGRNPNCNTAMVHNRRIMDCTVSMGPNGENRNCNAAMGQNQGNSNFPSQGNLSSNRYLSIDDPSNWSDALLAILGINESAAPVALNKSIQGLNRPLTPSLSTQVGCSYSQLESPKSMVRKHDQTTSSSQQSRGCNLQLLPVDGYSVPYRPSYNLNSPARSEVDATISIVSPLQFKPVTPDKRKPLEDRQVPQEVNSVYGSSSNERNDHEHNMVSLRSEENEGHCNEVLQNFVNSSSSAVSTTLQEHHILDEGNEQGFDLNKTPQQKTPKRRKHRPKVVIEGKPKRTPKPKPPENSISNDTPAGKRKYVRKIGLKISETLKANCVGKESAEGPQDVGNRKYVRKKILKTPETQEAKTVEDVRIPAVEPAAKSCRRTLNFDLESTQNGEIQDNTGFNQIERKQGSIAGFNLNFNPQDTELCTELNGVSGASAVQVRQQNGYIAGTSNLQNSTNQVLLRNSFLAEANVPTTPLANIKSQALNAIARIVTKRSAIPGHSVQLNEYSQVDRHAYGEGIGQIFFKADAASTDLDRATDPMLQINSQSFTKDMPNDDGKRGLKRRSIEQIYPHAIDVVHPPFMHQKLLKASLESDDGNNPLGRSRLETHKKKKTHDGFYANISTTSSGGAAGKDRPTQEERRGMNGVRANSSISQILSSCFGGNNISDKEINAGNVTTGNGYFHPMGTKQNIQKHHVSSERLPIQRSQTSTQVHDFNSLTAMVTYHRPTTSLKETAGSDYLGEIWACHANVSEQPQPAKSSLSNQLLSGKDQTSQRRHNDAVEGHRSLPTTRPKEAPRSDCLTEIRTCQANALEEKQTPNPCSPRQRGMDKMLENQYNSAVKGHQPSSTKARGTPKKLKSQVAIDEITYRLEELNICGDSKEQHQLVPYKGDNSIVLFEPKKRKTRPKVDLDPESDRLWKFLMGKEGSEGAEAIDKDKEKWWEEERAVFRGRADSFIARMHLVQGDRRFSRWKGSVVDSVIGVFLTQNVSDHLSSSAFMALAAKFPPQSTTIDETCCQTQVLVEEPDIQILEHCESIQYQGKIRRQPLFNHSSIVACESTEDRRYLTSGVSDAANKHNSITEEEILSQDSFDSFILQTADEQRSSSGSNSEAEDQTTGCKPNKNPGPTSINLLHQEGVTFEGFYSHVNGRTLLTERSIHMHHQSEKQDCNRKNPRFIGTNNLQSSSGFTGSSNSNIHHMQESLTSFSNFHLKMTADSRKLGEQYGGMSAEESLSSSRSTGSAVTEAYHAVKQTYQQSEIRIPEAAPFVKYGFLGKHPTHQGSSQRGTEIGNSAYSMNNQQHQNSKILQLERAYVKEPIRPAEILFQRETDARKQGSESSKLRGTNAIAEDRMPVVDRQKCFENTAAEENLKEQTYSSQVPRTAATNTVKTRKGKAEEEKKRAFDWDSLRKQVLLNGENRERSKDAVDSLNYEALRCADVKMISDAIRERGMNNMLAERMKDFLNRLVRDHGSIDLEWLRDVPPDKAKDYLLSIRGLGLKSVECVRLLTLHHLAFPVDTNVGRIAVRLGWVPLQPLPESLQLHLLELYPVLETIQKYLWPRLCKLDQPTLYELHYQMITFGKVFCTKSKPNCNACPMRAECRHFASAFASARLALPGSEEKGIVPSAVTMADDRIPKVEFKPLGLPPSESNSRSDAGFFNQRCEPIIEEPSTPESETTEILERDIEDAFYEDPDEIPTIKLNMEEFTMNLHNLMHDNMELQGDMSMALVALNPEAASIPTPKLKNVSRLRTEHQVYELPDSHPLLDRLDKRECDDPSPYLLAIWIPGETANSVQPPESTCQAQESGNLCNDNTCFSCNRTREANSQTVRGTILVPCRTAMRGSFPLNGTYFQVNEMFADHESSLNPIDVPRSWLWNLPRRTVFFGTSVSTIFKGLTTEEIQFCFWRGFVCVRGFDQQSRAPRPLMARLHFPASKLVKKKEGK